MVRDSIKEADALQRRSYVPEETRTSDRDDAADWLTAELVDGERDWSDTTIVELSNASGWSREHIARTLDNYFDPADGPRRSQIIDEIVSASIDVDTDGETYTDGFRDGFEAGIAFCVSNPDILANE